MIKFMNNIVTDTTPTTLSYDQAVHLFSDKIQQTAKSLNAQQLVGLLSQFVNENDTNKEIVTNLMRPIVTEKYNESKNFLKHLSSAEKQLQETVTEIANQNISEKNAIEAKDMLAGNDASARNTFVKALFKQNGISGDNINIETLTALYGKIDSSNPIQETDYAQHLPELPEPQGFGAPAATPTKDDIKQETAKTPPPKQQTLPKTTTKKETPKKTAPAQAKPAAPSDLVDPQEAAQAWMLTAFNNFDTHKDALRTMISNFKKSEESSKLLDTDGIDKLNWQTNDKDLAQLLERGIPVMIKNFAPAKNPDGTIPKMSLAEVQTTLQTVFEIEQALPDDLKQKLIAGETIEPHTIAKDFHYSYGVDLKVEWTKTLDMPKFTIKLDEAGKALHIQQRQIIATDDVDAYKKLTLTPEQQKAYLNQAIANTMDDQGRGKDRRFVEAMKEQFSAEDYEKLSKNTRNDIDDRGKTRLATAAELAEKLVLTGKPVTAAELNAKIQEKTGIALVTDKKGNAIDFNINSVRATIAAKPISSSVLSDNGTLVMTKADKITALLGHQKTQINAGSYGSVELLSDQTKGLLAGKLQLIASNDQLMEGMVAYMKSDPVLSKKYDDITVEQARNYISQFAPTFNQTIVDIIGNKSHTVDNVEMALKLSIQSTVMPIIEDKLKQENPAITRAELEEKLSAVVSFGKITPDELRAVGFGAESVSAVDKLLEAEKKKDLDKLGRNLTHDIMDKLDFGDGIMGSIISLVMNLFGSKLVAGNIGKDSVIGNALGALAKTQGLDLKGMGVTGNGKDPAFNDVKLNSIVMTSEEKATQNASKNTESNGLTA